MIVIKSENPFDAWKYLCDKKIPLINLEAEADSKGRIAWYKLFRKYREVKAAVFYHPRFDSRLPDYVEVVEL